MKYVLANVQPADIFTKSEGVNKLVWESVLDSSGLG
jgi:hypothetical protein